MMKQKEFDWLVENSTAVLTFANETTEHTWRVRLCAGRMLARLDSDNADSDYIDEFPYDIEYADMAKVDELYWDIICDIISVLGDAMYRDELSRYGFLSEYADKDDEGLAELLSYFGVSWPEFLADIFYMFGVHTESRNLLDDGIDDDGVWTYDEVDRVFEAVPYADVLIDYGEGVASYWQVAYAENGLFYRSFGLFDDGDDVDRQCLQWGVLDDDDELSLECLRDGICADIEGYECSLNYDTALFELLDIDIEEGD